MMLSSSKPNKRSSCISPTTSASASQSHSHSEKKRIRASSPRIQQQAIERNQSRLSTLFSPASSRNSSLLFPHVAIVTNDNIRVLCRVRPLNKTEISTSGNTECIYVSEDKTQIEITTTNNGSSTYGPICETFAFNRVFDMNTTQEEVFQISALPLINNLFAGYNATIMCYGQTGSGKTWSMIGDSSTSETSGIIPRTALELFEKAKNISRGTLSFNVTFIEIYNETIRDLLDDKCRKSNLQIREDTSGEFFVNEVTEATIVNAKDLLKLMSRGSKNRAVGVTNMNEVSSRSHAVFTITLVQENETKDVTLISKLLLVDLAGSETIKKSGAEGGQAKEAASINQSLSTLGLVINALSNKSSKHIPYRNSALTKLLKSSLGYLIYKLLIPVIFTSYFLNCRGNSKTSLIITCSPSISNATESVSTLRFGERAKNVATKTSINETRRSTTADSSLLAEIIILKEQLRAAQLESNSRTPEEAVYMLNQKQETSALDKLQLGNQIIPTDLS
jgi:kinesin family protein 5